MPGHFDFHADHQRILLQDVRLAVRCGLHPWERDPARPNQVLVNVELFCSVFSDPPEGAFVDYDRIYDYLLKLEGAEHIDLLESILAPLTQFIFEDPLIAACRVSIVKPEIFDRAARAGVEWFRTRPT